MIGFSPRGTIDIVLIFPIMFIIGLALDILGLLTLIGGTVLNIIGILTIGLWILIRSSGQRDNTNRKQKEPKGNNAAAKEETSTIVKEGAETATKETTTGLAKKNSETTVKNIAKTASKKLGGAILRVGAVSLVEFIPLVNAVFFGWTLMVIWEAVSDFKNFSLEAGD
jgi:hypothetical protein